MPKSKSKKAKAKKAATSKKAPIPPGFRTVTPYLVINGAAEAIDWYKKAFNAKELSRQAVPDGKLMHARIRIGDSIVMLSDYFPGGNAKSPDALGSSPVTLHIYINNVDKLWQQAVDAGAKVSMPIDNTFWGERYGQLTDPYGHHWSLSQQINMTKKEKDEKQKQAMAMFAQGEHPSRTEEPQIAQQ
jgi:PhnB protein